MKIVAPLAGLALLVLLSGPLYAQLAAPFSQEIAAFKKADSLTPPPQHAILFIGSSSFTKWVDVQHYFPSTPIVNRAFGGSSLPDIIHYANEIIFPYHPKQIVIYCGDNDLAAADTVSAQTVLNRVKKLVSVIRDSFPTVPLVYVSIKPSPSREKLMLKAIAANELIRSFLQQDGNAVFADVFHKMLGTDGHPIASIFLEDKLHMNKNGYAIWQKELAPLLLK